jgi:isopenicillin N synthase-like dioxygenase
VTVAPRATLPGLEVRRWGTDSFTEVEGGMSNEGVVVLVGECLSRVSNNHFPSLLHRPSAAHMHGRLPPRISAPFFLRGRPDAVLDIRVCRAELLGPIDPSVAAPVTIDHFADNVDGTRDRLPWKRLPYYASFRYG